MKQKGRLFFVLGFQLNFVNVFLDLIWDNLVLINV
jgi:hypothetical protein